MSIAVVEVLTFGAEALALRCGDFLKVPCPDCDGIGDFEMPDDSYETCVMCRGRGWLYHQS